MTTTTATTPNATHNSTRREIFFPACTEDYRVEHRPYGFGLVANRHIKEGRQVFENSYEYLFTDVQDGDMIRFFNYEEANKLTLKAFEKKKKKAAKLTTDSTTTSAAAELTPPKLLPPKIPLTREMLLSTHGVPSVTTTGPTTGEKTAGIVSWQLEVPHMLANHSCSPNAVDESDDEYKGEVRAARDIQKDEEIVFNYTFQYYDSGPFFDECACGSKDCMGSMNGFKALPPDRKEQALPYCSNALKAMHEAEMGVGLPVTFEQKEHPPRQSSLPPPPPTAVEDDVLEVLSLVVSGPSHAAAPVAIQINENTGRYELIAMKNIAQGKQVYEYYTESWPIDEDGRPVIIDMVSSKHIADGDLPEGTTIRMDPRQYGRPKEDGRLVFSGFDLLFTHSSTPNMVYNYKSRSSSSADRLGWHATYASHAISKGDVLTVDFNTIYWDRGTTSGEVEEECMGFSHLPPSVQDELYYRTSWLHVSLEEQLQQQKQKQQNDKSAKSKTNKKKKVPQVVPGEVLSHHIRSCWDKLKNPNPSTTSPKSDNHDDDRSSSSCSSSSSSSSSDEE